MVGMVSLLINNSHAIIDCCPVVSESSLAKHQAASRHSTRIRSQQFSCPIDDTSGWSVGHSSSSSSSSVDDDDVHTVTLR